jgi:uncharacterized membrane protein YjjB (DUF3815 family)
MIPALFLVIPGIAIKMAMAAAYLTLYKSHQNQNHEMILKCYVTLFILSTSFALVSIVEVFW